MEPAQLQIFEGSAYILKKNICLTFQEQKRGDIFEYHNMSAIGVAPIRNFSNIAGDKQLGEISSFSCWRCRVHYNPCVKLFKKYCILLKKMLYYRGQPKKVERTPEEQAWADNVARR